MAAKGKAFYKAQRSVQGFAAILKSAACEWFLIFLLLIDALLSYVLTKLAHSCNLQTPCILCSRLDHLLSKENPHNYRNLLCTNHRLEISSLVSCYKHNKLVDGNEMCDACLCSFASTNNKPRFNSKMQKLRLHTGGNGARGKLLTRDSIPHCIKTRPCSCCSKPWKTRPNAQGMLQLKSSVYMATKTKIPYPRCLNSRDSFKQARDKIFGSVTLQYPGKTGFSLLSHVGYSELRITSDSELEDVLPEEDDDKSLIYEKSELTEDSLLQSITQIPLKPHCNDYDQVKPSINFVDSRPSSLESHVQVDVQKPHDVTSPACDAKFHGLSELNWLPRPDNPIASPSTWAELISLDDASSPASNVLGLNRANSMEKSELTDSLNQESPLSCSPEFITLHHDPQIAGKLATSEETRTNSMEIASLNHSELTSTKVEMFRDSDSEFSKSDEKHANHKSDSESSDSDKKNTDHNSDSESSESNEEHEVNFNAKQSFEKETDIGTNDLKQPPLISTTAAECSKTDEEVYKSDIKNVSDGMDHSSASEQDVFDCSVGQSLKNEIDLVVNDLKQSPLISTMVEECPKIDEVVYVSDNRNTIDDMNHIGLSESSESDKEQENVNFSIEQSSEKETDIVTDDLKQCPLISTTVEECPKTNEGVYEYAIKNTNDYMDHDNISESSENGNEYEIFNFATRRSLEKEIDIVPEVTYESVIKNTNDDMNHSNVDESFESDKQQDVLNCATGQPLETDPDIVSTDMEQFSMQNSPVGLVNQSSSDDEGHNFSISDGDLQKESSGEFNIIRALDRSGVDGIC
ncbi:putative myosin-binding protein 4, partial [Cucurbita argyrosperma subsp. argyrosperma]